MSITKEELIALLQDPDVISALHNAMETRTIDQPIQQGEIPETGVQEGEELINLKEMVASLKSALQGKEQELTHEKTAHIHSIQENQRLQQENTENQQNYSKNLTSFKNQAEEKIQSLNQQAQTCKQTYESEIAQLQSKNKNLEGSFLTLEGECSTLKGALFSARAVISGYEKEQEMFRIYQDLSPSVKEGLCRVFHQGTFENFVACCAQKDTAEALWLFTKTRIFFNELTDLEQLDLIFRYSIQCHNSTSETPILHLVEGDTGSRFDNEFHLGTPDSKKAGTVDRKSVV